MGSTSSYTLSVTSTAVRKQDNSYSSLTAAKSSRIMDEFSHFVLGNASIMFPYWAKLIWSPSNANLKPFGFKLFFLIWEK